MEALNAALQPLVDGIRDQPGLALLAALLVWIGTLGVLVAIWSYCLRLSRRYARLIRGTDGASLERMLLDYADDAASVRDGIQAAQRQGGDLAQQLSQTLQRVGLVRYDALPDVGGLRSFSLALLDDRLCGIVLTGLYARTETHLYAKPILQGRSPVMLTAEEKQAIANATLPSQMPQETV